MTLVELLISVSLLAIISTALAGVIIVSMRTTPPTEARVDDARGLQGLVTWLPEDVDAAAPDGFNRDPGWWPCAGAGPASSTNILAIQWWEHSATSTRFDATYRYEKAGDTWRIVRYKCTDSGPAQRNNLTSELPPWTPGSAYTVMCAVVVDSTYSGNCPAASTHPTSNYTPSPVRSLKFRVDLPNGLDVTIDAAPKNPDESLSNDPDATANQPPTVHPSTITLYVPSNQTVVYDLAGYMSTLDDPDGDDSLMTVSIDPTEPAPTYLTSATTAYNGPTQFELTLTAGTTVGTDPRPLMLVFSDERGGWKVVSATIVVTAPPNVGPWLDAADPDTKLVGIVANQLSTTLDIPALFNVQDDQPVDQLNVVVTATSTGPLPGMVDPTKFSLVPSGHELIVNFVSGFNPSAGGQIYADLQVVDADGEYLDLYLVIEVLPNSTPNTPPVAPTGNVSRTIEAGQTATIDVTSVGAHGVYDTDVGDDLTATIQSAPSGIVATASNTTVELAVASTAPVGPASPVVVRVSDLAGAYVDVTITVTVTAPPPPPTNCVLGSLSAATGSGSSTVARQGGGTGAHKLIEDVIVTITYTGSCDGLRLNYNSGDATGLGTGVGRVFPPGSPSSIRIVGHFNGGTEKFTPGSKVLTASTSSAVTPNSVTATINVT